MNFINMSWTFGENTTKGRNSLQLRNSHSIRDSTIPWPLNLRNPLFFPFLFHFLLSLKVLVRFWKVLNLGEGLTKQTSENWFDWKYFQENCSNLSKKTKYWLNFETIPLSSPISLLAIISELPLRIHWISLNPLLISSCNCYYFAFWRSFFWRENVILFK